jgi:hypothetical protein
MAGGEPVKQPLHMSSDDISFHFLYSRTHYIPGTRVQETKIVPICLISGHKSLYPYGRFLRPLRVRAFLPRVRASFGGGK